MNMMTGAATGSVKQATTTTKNTRKIEISPIVSHTAVDNHNIPFTDSIK
jgi:hypothetical protein